MCCFSLAIAVAERGTAAVVALLCLVLIHSISRCARSIVSCSLILQRKVSRKQSAAPPLPPALPEKPAVLEKAVALFAYDAQRPDELNLVEGGSHLTSEFRFLQEPGFERYLGAISIFVAVFFLGSLCLRLKLGRNIS